MTERVSKPPKRMGRPRKYPSDGKRPTLTFRIQEETYAALKAAAEMADRSISEEVEHRIKRSIMTEGVLGAPEPYSIGKLVHDAIRVVEASTKRKWHEDDVVAEICHAAATSVLGVLKSKGHPEPIDPATDENLKAARAIGTELGQYMFVEQVKELMHKVEQGDRQIAASEEASQTDTPKEQAA